MKATYTRKCVLCGELSDYILRDTNVNSSILDTEIPFIINHKNDKEFLYCEKCKQITKQELVAYNY